MPVAKEVRVGESLIRIDGDLLIFRPVGALSAEELTQLIALVDELRAASGRYLCLVDLHRAGLIPADLRRRLIEYGSRHPPLAIAFCRVSPVVRGVNALLIAALNLLGKQRQNVAQFSTEEAALTWIAAERERLRA